MQATVGDLGSGILVRREGVTGSAYGGCGSEWKAAMYDDCTRGCNHIDTQQLYPLTVLVEMGRSASRLHILKSSYAVKGTSFANMQWMVRPPCGRDKENAQISIPCYLRSFALLFLGSMMQQLCKPRLRLPWVSPYHDRDCPLWVHQ